MLLLARSHLSPLASKLHTRRWVPLRPQRTVVSSEVEYFAMATGRLKPLHMTILVTLHVLAAVVWIGGMFFAYMVLRQSVGLLEPAVRLAFWQRVFQHFFPWVWASIILLLVSGYGMLFLYFGGFAGAGLHIHLMQGTGIVMMMLFLNLFFAPWRRFNNAVERESFADAAKELDQIRRIVAINLVLGLLTVIVGASGRFW
jgi:uncharacterized membrane protein